MTRLRNSLVGVLAILLTGAAVAATGYTLVNGGLRNTSVPAFAEFERCGQGLREGGDVKLRGVLVGRIGGLQRVSGDKCRVQLDLFPKTLDQIPSNAAAQIRAKTIFGEKWVALLYPEHPSEDALAANDVIPASRTIDPLEVETILNTALPLLEAIDPQRLSGALTALAEGFVGEEDAAIRGIEQGIEALKTMNRNEDLLEEGLDQLAGSADVLDDVDEDLLHALDNLDDVNRFTSANSELIAENLEKAPVLLRELSTLFEVRLEDLTKIVNQGATVVGVLAARADDLDRLLDQLPRFNSNWIRNLNHVCRYRQHTDEPGKSEGEIVPGRCWRVHNVFSTSRGPYAPGEEPKPGARRTAPALGHNDLGRLLYTPAITETLRGRALRGGTR